MEFKTSRMEVGEYIKDDVNDYISSRIYWSIVLTSPNNYGINLFVRDKILRLNFWGWKSQGTI